MFLQNQFDYNAYFMKLYNQYFQAALFCEILNN